MISHLLFTPRLHNYSSYTVVWNPWEKKSKSMVHFGNDEYKQMLCVDGAAVEKPITLKTGEEWRGQLELSMVPSSFCIEHFELQRKYLRNSGSNKL